MGSEWNKLWGYLDYAVRYNTLKMGRTLMISVLVMLLILLFRRIFDGRKGRKLSGSRLYSRVWLWALLFPVPFMGTLKLSTQYFRWRNAIYIFLYENIMGNPLWSRLYFSGIVIMVLWLLARKIQLRRRIKRLPPADSAVLPIPKEMVRRVKIRLNPSNMPPFSTGIFTPVIVLPECMLEQLNDREFREVLLHEYNHIRRGHLVLYFIMDCFRIIWFFNPLVHFCIRWFKEDLELLCDHDTIRSGVLSSKDYGLLLIRSLHSMSCNKDRPERTGGNPALASVRSFQVMEKRIRLIAEYGECRESHRSVICVVMAGVLMVFFILARALSYPVYTPFGDYSMYSWDGREVIFSDNPEFDDAIQVTEGGLVVQNDKVKQLLSKTGRRYGEEDYFWIYYGGYMKQPGIGGGGDIVEFRPYSTEEAVVRITCWPKEGIDLIVDWIYRYM